ncbi:MAG: pyridoxamine 5'-phosphate oxidase family protein, partial [Burkholderiaceae bacterium]
MKKLRGIRTDYTKASLLDSEIPENPYNLLCLWMDSAIAEKIPEPTAICLSTIKPNGRVNSRIVLAKEIQEDGLVFFTNY